MDFFWVIINNTKECIQIVFTLIVLVAFIKYLFYGDEEIGLLQKIIGGLSVFVVAMTAQNPTVYVFSILIGGLIIASEEFISFIAAVLMSRGEKISDVIREFRAVPATPKEVNKKAREEARDEITQESPQVAAVRADRPRHIKGSNVSSNLRIDKISKIKREVRSILEKQYQGSYYPDMKLLNATGSTIVDGIIKNGESISTIVEIKYITQRSFENMRHIIPRFWKKMVKLGVDSKILLVVVSDDMTLEAHNLISSDVQSIAKVMSFKYGDGSLTKIQ